MSHFEDESFAGRIGTIHPVKGEEEDLASREKALDGFPVTFFPITVFETFFVFKTHAFLIPTLVCLRDPSGTPCA